MNWLFGKKTIVSVENKPKPTIDSIRRKLANYESTEGRSKFEGPSMKDTSSIFEFEKVAIDPDASGIRQVVPFSC